MTTKKTRRGTAQKSKLTRRAEQIINDAEAYSNDTRNAVKNALDESAADLAELVRRAERGEDILDISSPPPAAPIQPDDGEAIRALAHKAIECRCGDGEDERARALYQLIMLAQQQSGKSEQDTFRNDIARGIFDLTIDYDRGLSHWREALEKQ